MFINITEAKYLDEEKTRVKVCHNNGTSESFVTEDRPGWIELHDILTPDDYVAD
jgi:hypothetical protein